MKKRYLNIVLLMLSCIAVPMIANAQIIDPNDAPIDGGLSLLLAAGVGYGVKKYRDGQKLKNNEEPDLK